jgi:hypothetical protein
VQLIGLPDEVLFQLMMIVVVVYVPVPEMEKLPEKVWAGTVMPLFVQLSCAVTGTPYRLLMSILVAEVGVMVQGYEDGLDDGQMSLPV